MFAASLAFSIVAFIAPVPPMASTISRANTACMIFGFKTETERPTPVREAFDDDEKFGVRRFLGSKLQRLKALVPRKWRTDRSDRNSASVTDLLVTVNTRSAEKRRVSGKTTSWENSLLPAAPMTPRNLAEIGWEELLPASSAMQRDLAELNWEDSLLPEMPQSVIASVTPVGLPATSAPAAKRNLAEVGWEDSLLPLDPAPQLPARRHLAETSWEENLLPSGDAPAAGMFRKTGFTSWEDMLP